MSSTTQIPGYLVGTWDIDATHSTVGFSVRHMMVSKVPGNRPATNSAPIEVLVEMAKITLGMEGSIKMPNEPAVMMTPAPNAIG